MASDLLEQLARHEVPPPPPSATFDHDVHRRVNHTLAVLHVVEFVLQALPHALLHFMRAVGGLIGFTITGQFRPVKQDTTKRDSDESV